MIEAILIGYILAITFAANLVRAKIHRSEPSRLAYLSYVFTLLAFAAGPLIWIQRTSAQFSAATIILVGVAIFWLAILASRVYADPSSR